MPRPSKRQKAAIDRENRKKARSSSLISIRVTEDVPDCIRNPSVEESGSVPDLQQPNSLAQISCREDDESSTDWSLDFQTMPSVDDPPSSPLREYDTHTMSAAIPETPLEFAFVDDSFISEFDLLVEEIEGTEHSEESWTEPPERYAPFSEERNMPVESGFSSEQQKWQNAANCRAHTPTEGMSPSFAACSEAEQPFSADGGSSTNATACLAEHPLPVQGIGSRNAELCQVEQPCPVEIVGSMCVAHCQAEQPLSAGGSCSTGAADIQLEKLISDGLSSLCALEGAAKPFGRSICTRVSTRTAECRSEQSFPAEESCSAKAKDGHVKQPFPAGIMNPSGTTDCRTEQPYSVDRSIFSSVEEHRTEHSFPDKGACNTTSHLSELAGIYLKSSIYEIYMDHSQITYSNKNEQIKGLSLFMFLIVLTRKAEQRETKYR
ncbi:uncharacterized protein LOC109406299 [Aedes albopictus]|uniref:Uncharacterized protein n=1 Tax=Aedes albopictus TaxID=7160 RepID=A0ABM1ZG75_AEDAL